MLFITKVGMVIKSVDHAIAGILFAAAGIAALSVAIVAFDELTLSLVVFLTTAIVLTISSIAARLPPRFHQEVRFQSSTPRIIARGAIALILTDTLVLFVGWILHHASGGRDLDIGTVFVSVCGGFLVGIGLVWVIASSLGVDAH